MISKCIEINITIITKWCNYSHSCTKKFIGAIFGGRVIDV